MKIIFFLNWGARLQIFKRLRGPACKFLKSWVGGGPGPLQAPMDGTPMTKPKEDSSLLPKKEDFLSEVIKDSKTNSFILLQEAVCLSHISSKEYSGSASTGK